MIRTTSLPTCPPSGRRPRCGAPSRNYIKRTPPPCRRRCEPRRLSAHGGATTRSVYNAASLASPVAARTAARQSSRRRSTGDRAPLRCDRLCRRLHLRLALRSGLLVLRLVVRERPDRAAEPWPAGSHRAERVRLHHDRDAPLRRCEPRGDRVRDQGAARARLWVRNPRTCRCRRARVAPVVRGGRWHAPIRRVECPVRRKLCRVRRR